MFGIVPGNDFLKLSLITGLQGKDVEDDIAVFQEAFRRNGLGKDDVVFMALENSVYIPMNQAMWLWDYRTFCRADCRW